MSSAPLMITVSGVRGIAHQSLTPELVETFVGSFAQFQVFTELLHRIIIHFTFYPIQKSRFPGKRLMVVLGKDSRVSGPEFEQIAIKTFLSLGCDVYNLGMCPTPTVSAFFSSILLFLFITLPQVQYMVIKLEAQAGLIITSSHNPTEWNGFYLSLFLIKYSS